jgi:histidine triad (HIT) family protein
VADFEEEDAALIGKVILAAKKIAAQKGIDDFRLVFNNGPGADQSVFHVHLHLLAGRPFGWPPG